MQLTLEQALIRYDRKQSTRKYYNPHALNLYLARAEEVQAEIAKGKSPRQAVIDSFTDRLRDYLLREMGLTVCGA